MNLDIPRGSIYGIVGPNGSGKTTAITMATGLLRPTSGGVWVEGHPMWGSDEESIAGKRAYGLLADNLPVFDRLSGAEYLRYLGLLRGMDQETTEERSKDLLRALDLEDAGGKYIADYSAGMTKKILLAGALLHRPEILILDEPLEAVDPVSSQIIRQILRNYSRAGGTVVLSSHVMELVEGLCDHVAVIQAGTVRAAGSIDEVRQGRSLTDAFVELVGGAELADGSLAWLNDAHQPAEAETGELRR